MQKGGKEEDEEWWRGTRRNKRMAHAARMRRSPCAVLQKLHSSYRLFNPPLPHPWPFKSGNQATRDLLYDTSLLNVCAEDKALCCRAPLAAAAKETSPLVVPNNSLLSQVQQQQVWQGKTLLFSQHRPEQLQHATQSSAWHVCHNSLLQDHSSCCEQHSGSDCVIQLFGLGKEVIRWVQRALRWAQLCSSLHTLWRRTHCSHGKRKCNFQTEHTADKSFAAQEGKNDEHTGGNLGTPTWPAHIQGHSSRELSVNSFDSYVKEPRSC